MAYKIEKVLDGSVTTPRGFKAAGIACGIKKSGKLDLGLLVSQVRCTAAGVFTTNVVKGSSLLVTRDNLSDGHAQALLVNSGNANACNGERGLLDARELARITGRLLDIPNQDILPNSTGVIGEYLPLPRLRDGIESLVPLLSEEGGPILAQAMMTTDTVPKYTARRITAENQSFTIGGIAKGAGMIHPNMATMFGFLTTDARISSESLRIFLMEAVEQSFNRFTIDGDTSCCDTVLFLANGLSSGTDIVPDSSSIAHAFREALLDLCLELTYRLAHDGEGVTKVVKFIVNGFPSKEAAAVIARSIAISPLVKTAIHGEDPNWGRILNAAGYSGVNFDPTLVDLWIGDIQILHHGEKTDYKDEDAHRVMQRTEYDIVLNFNAGKEKDFYITTDFSKDYVDINADYRHRT
ncbi:MAG: bifunctional glutamate N-acetyltransferase/amino-acid acetyltransferase ArgJ [bacterium]|jgi:glutamate N-acetyltransferase/amino-acid N-acetyltransferase|nr:bifunctional glutamate N-acetyltransferase/amino-acid acetyltransferase ArgJ [bacterium]